MPKHSFSFIKFIIFLNAKLECFEEWGILFNLKKLPTIEPNLPSLCPDAKMISFLFSL